MTARNLLVELFVEELPPKALKGLGESFCKLIFAGLRERSLAAIDSVATSFASPRRLTAHITNVAGVAPDSEVMIKLMPVSVAIGQDGKPTDALRKRLTKEGRAVLADMWPNSADGPDRLLVQTDGKAEAVYLRSLAKGTTLNVGLEGALEDAIRELPIPKVMTYQLADGWSSVKFVRPAHGLVALHGAEIISVSCLGLNAGRTTRGHRFEAKQRIIELQSADSYEKQLEIEGAVIASFAARRAEIECQLKVAAGKTGLKPIEDDALLDEVTALVERPNVLICRFEKDFLDVPQECLILTMKSNQKYFPLLDANGKLSNQFLMVSNIRPADPSRVIEGNERVIRPRLADAKFFFDQDRKQSLESRLPRLDRVVYHQQLGSQAKRVERLKGHAYHIGFSLGGDQTASRAERAASLAKADLVTNMVAEFPELQGVMGRYYALNDKEDAEIAEAIREQYLPRGAGDELPQTRTGMALALADKLDTLCGIFATSQKPSGAKDPFGLRRAAIGVLRIAIECRLEWDLKVSIEFSLSRQPIVTKPELIEEVYEFVMERLRAYYLEGGSDLKVTTEMFDAVLANRPAAPLDFDKRLRALAEFLKLSDAQSLAAANKRISNILRKSGSESFGAVNEDLLRDPAEQVLSEQVVAMTKVTEPLFAARDYSQALTKLASLRAAVDAFFDGVMVMTDDQALQTNRLALLAQLRALFSRVADLSRLPG